MADGLDHLSGHGLVGQEPERPAGMACGWGTAPQCDQPCLPLAIQQGTPGGIGRLLPVEGGLKPLCNQPLSDAKDAIDTDGAALGDSCIRPSRPIRIGFQKDIGMAYLVGCRLAFLGSSVNCSRSS